MDFKQFVKQNEQQLKDQNTTLSTLGQFIRECQDDYCKIKFIQLRYLIQASGTPNFIYKLLNCQSEEEAILLIKNLISVFDNAKISAHIYIYFIHAVIAAKGISLDIDIPFIDPANYNFNHLDKVGLDKTFGRGGYLESNLDLTLNGDKLTAVNSESLILTIPHGVKTIEEEAFKNSKAQFITLPKAINNLPNNLFMNNRYLIDIFLSEDIKVVPKQFFYNANALKNVIASGIEVVEERGFANTAIGTTRFGERTIKHVKDQGFYNCERIDKLYLFALESVGDEAFANCTNITDIRMQLTKDIITKYPQLYLMFGKDPSSISKILEAGFKFTSGIIPNNFFEGLTNLHKLTVLGEVTEFGKDTFSSLTKLEQFRFNFVGEKLPDEAFENINKDILLPNFANVKEVGKLALSNLNLLEANINFNNITLIKDYAFRSSVLPSDVVLNEVIEIGAFAFKDVNTIENLTITSKPQVDADAFKGLTNIKNIKFYFDASTNIKYFYEIFSSSIEQYNELLPIENITIEFSNGIVPNNFFQGLTNVKTIEILGEVTELGANVFEGLENLENLKLNFVGEELKDYAFYNLPQLSTLPYLSKLKRIGNYALANLDLSNSNINFSNLEHIGDYAFKNSVFANTLTIPKANIGIGAFLNTKGFERLELLESNYYYNNEDDYFLPYQLFAETITDFNNQYQNLKQVKVSGKLTENYFKDWRQVEQVILDLEIDHIPNNTFKNCSSLLAIKISNSNIAIGDNAFDNCTNLTKFNIDNQSYENKLVLNNVKSIGSYAFNNVSAIESITVNASEQIHKNAFSSLTNLIEIKYTYNENNKIDNLFELFSHSIEEVNQDYSKLKTLELKFLSETIPNYFFANLVNVENITINGDIYEIGEGAFNGLANLENLKLNFVGEELKDYTFYNLEKLKTIPSLIKVKTLHEHTFKNNLNVESISIGNIEQGKEYLFSNFPNLKEISYYSNVVPKEYFSNLENIEVINLLGNDIVIEEGAFANSNQLKEINNIENVIEIYSLAFVNTAITEITLSPYLNYLGVGVFSGCYQLEKLTMPIKFNYIGELFDFEANENNTIATYIKDEEYTSDFYIPNSLEEVTINGGELVKSIFSNTFFKININTGIDFIPKYSFYNAGLINIDLSNVTKIEKYAFSESDVALANLTNIEVIEQFAFENSKLTSLSLGNNLREMDYRSLNGVNLTNLVANSTNQISFTNSTLVDNTNGEIIYIHYGANSNYVIPNKVKTIRSNTFTNKDYFEAIDTNLVETVESNVFENLHNLKEITFNEHLIDYNANIVNNCQSLRTLNFNINDKSNFESLPLSFLIDEQTLKNIKVVKVASQKLHMNFLVGIKSLEELDLYSLKTDHIDNIDFDNITIDTVVLPKTLTSINNNFFIKNDIKTISDNPGDNYTVVDQVLYINNELVFVFDENLSSLELKDNIVAIKDNALQRSMNIKTLILHKPNNYINQFNNLTGVNELRLYDSFDQPINELLPNSITELTKISYYYQVIKPNTIANLLALKEVDLLGVEEIEENAFVNNPNLTKVTNTNYLTKISDNAFVNSGNISELIISERLQYLSAKSFVNTTIDSFVINNNVKYVNNDGVIIDKDLKEIILIANQVNSAVVIKEQLNVLDNTHLNSNKIETLVIEDVSEIKKGAFINLPALNKLTIKNVVTLNDYIFGPNTQLSFLTIPFIGKTKNDLKPLNYLFEDNVFNINVFHLEVLKQESFDKTFVGVEKLRHLKLPNVNEITNGTFSGCSRKLVVHLPSRTVLKSLNESNKHWNKVSSSMLFSKLKTKII